MNEKQKKQIAKAVESLRFDTIFLFESSLHMLDDFPEDEDFDSIEQKWKREISYRIDKIDGVGNVLVATIKLSIRLCNGEEDEDGEQEYIYAEIDTSYIASYVITKAVDEECLMTFVKFHSINDVWPFFRQQIFDYVQKSVLPPIKIPLFANSL